MRTQRYRIVGDPRPEDHQATLLDEFVKGTFDGMVGAVRQPDHVALHQLDRTVDESAATASANTS